MMVLSFYWTYAAIVLHIGPGSFFAKQIQMSARASSSMCARLCAERSFSYRDQNVFSLACSSFASTDGRAYTLLKKSVARLPISCAKWLSTCEMHRFHLIVPPLALLWGLPAQARAPARMSIIPRENIEEACMGKSAQRYAHSSAAYVKE